MLKDDIQKIFANLKNRGLDVAGDMRSGLDSLKKGKARENLEQFQKDDADVGAMLRDEAAKRYGNLKNRGLDVAGDARSTWDKVKKMMIFDKDK